MKGYRYYKSKENKEKTLKFEFEPGASVGRFVSRMVKTMLDLEVKDPKKYVCYLIDNPESLSFSSSLPFLINKYKLKYEAGHKHAGPFYTKSVTGLFKLIVRTMMKYKGKHKQIYEKICVLDKKTEGFQSLKIKTRNNSLTRKTSLKQLISML